MKKINNGEYINKKQYVPAKIDLLANQEYDNEEYLLKEQFQIDLERTFNPNEKLADRIFTIAWREGHSGGYKDVLIQYEQLINISEKELNELL
jgi:hypothetical protein